MTIREGESFSVLLIKNDLDDFHFIKQSFEKSSGFPAFIDLASNLEEAFEKLQNRFYHLALVEAEIEDKTPDFLEKIGKAHSETPFVLLLPVKDDRLVREAMRCGIADIIIKSENHFPYNPSDENGSVALCKTSLFGKTPASVNS